MRVLSRLSMRVLLAASFFVCAFATPSNGAVSPQLDALYVEVLQHPGNSDLNLRFAREAEAAGVLWWALSAYERVTINDPGNAEAQAGLQRVRRKLQPDTSQVTLEAGGGYESNPRYYLGPRRNEGVGLASAILFDERAISGMRWRTTGAVTGLFYSQSNDLDYANAELNTGPVVDLFPGWAVVPAIGGSAAYYDHHFYYGEGALTATFEGASQGAFKSFQVKTAYRSYDEFFPSANGFYTEGRARFAFPNLLGSSSVLILSPWVLYSDLSGTVLLSAATSPPSTAVIAPIRCRRRATSASTFCGFQGQASYSRTCSRSRPTCASTIATSGTVPTTRAKALPTTL